jgi:hypothetical protein
MDPPFGCTNDTVHPLSPKRALHDCEWTRTSESTWALPPVGAVKGFCGMPPWIAVARGRLVGIFHTLAEARAALEKAATAAGHRVLY